MVVLKELYEGSSSTSGHRYDVFLSFRGIDTRHSFTDHLHKALVDANITTFLDDEEIEIGEDLKPELKSAIEASRASIIILSKNYAASTWCLDELVLILEQRLTSNHIVIPIFYLVEPTHVRKQQSTFGDAMAEYKNMMEAETNANKRSQWVQKIDRWNKALIEVADLKGKDVNGRSGITNLVDKCLISIGENNKLMMHQLLQEMGRSLVRQESPDKPWERSRLWCHEESFKVLKRKKCKGNLLGLALDLRMLRNEKLLASFELKTKAMSKMDNLMLLQLNYVKIKGSYKNFPKELRWLCMHGFSLKSIPSDLRMDNLVSLDMSYSNIESIAICYSNSRPGKRQKLIGSCSKDKRFLGSLKILNLSFCEQLRNLCGFEGLPVLEKLIVRNCIGLVEVCESIKQCVELVLIDLSYCHKLENLPTTICMLKKVQKILLDGCNLGESRIEIRDIDSSEMLKAKNICRNTKTTSSTILEAIPNYLKIFTGSLPRSLVRLSLENNNLSTESFPVDFSCLSMLKQLYLDDNPIVSLPNCVKSLPSIEILSMVDCAMLMAVEHPPHTLRHLMIYPYRKQLSKTLLQRVVFDPEMTPLTLMFDMEMLAFSSYEFEGMVKVQPIKGVEVNLLHSLGWTNIDDIGDKRVGTDFWFRGSEESEIQMYYEFGIFSTIYEGENIPNWVTHRSKGSSISFIIPSSPNNLRGLNFCYGLMVLPPNYEFSLPMIVLNNITKNNTWMYHHYIHRAYVDGECLVLLSHWMFGMNEMEVGDHVTVTLTEQHYHFTKECGVGFVYDEGKTDEEEEDVLGYYKSWSHIIGGDLIGFQLTTGEYILDNMRFFRHDSDLHPYNPICGDYPGFRGGRFKENQVYFRAISQRKSNILGHTCQIGVN